MKCDRCKEADRPVKEMLHITLHPIPVMEDEDDTQQLFLCPRCSLFILSLLGASQHIITVKDPVRNRWITDAVGVNKNELMSLSLKMFLESEKMPAEEKDDA